MSIHIEVRRGDGTVCKLAAAEFDDFEFADGDRLAVLPAAEAAELPFSLGDRHVEIAPGRAIRVPEVWKPIAWCQRHITPRDARFTFQRFRCRAAARRGRREGAIGSNPIQ